MRRAFRELVRFQGWAAPLCCAGIVVIVVIMGLRLKPETISSLGEWLAGTLTPGLLLLSIFSFRTAEKARREQGEAQTRAAEMTERATFLAHKEDFNRRLSYLGSCVLSQKSLSFEEHNEMMKHDRANGHIGKGGYEWLWLILIDKYKGAGDANEQVDFGKLHEPGAIFYINEFQAALIEIHRIAHSAGLSSHLDRRIAELPGLFTFFDLWKTDVDHEADKAKIPFKDFFKSTLTPPAR